MHVSWGVTVKVDITKMSTQSIYIQALWHTHTHTQKYKKYKPVWKCVLICTKIQNSHFNWEMVKYED